MIKNLFGILFSASLAGCGGGSGGGGVESSPIAGEVNSLKTSAFSGNYVSDCFAVLNGTNYETGDALYAKPFITVNGSSSTTGSAAFRFDFYDDSKCSTEPLGSLKNDNVSNLFSLHGDIKLGSRLATRVFMDFLPASNAFTQGPTSDTVLYGTDLRLKLPQDIFGRFTVKDLWWLDGTALYEGSYTLGSDGYPVVLETSSTTTKLPTLPPPPASACAAKTLSWDGNGASCFADAKPTASGRSSLLSNIGYGRLGTAQFTCDDGAWKATSNSSCAFEPSGPVLPTCPSQSFTWTQGSETCSGIAPETIRGNDISVINTISGKQGGGRWSCTLDATWQLWSTDFPPTCFLPSPPITDPRQLAQDKNCLACHAVTGKGYSGPGSSGPIPSFEEIAVFYRANPTSIDAIANLVKNGSTGVFGSTPMPANSQVTDSDLAIILPWVLAQPK